MKKRDHALMTGFLFDFPRPERETRPRSDRAWSRRETLLQIRHAARQLGRETDGLTFRRFLCVATGGRAGRLDDLTEGDARNVLDHLRREAWDRRIDL